MAAVTLTPKVEHKAGDRSGKVYRIVTVHVPEVGVGHEIAMGEAGITGAGEVEYPSGASVTLTFPSGTSATGGIDSDDMNKKVTLNSDTLGDHTIIVVHQGRNAAAL
jgi:hypothetical protein